MVDAVELNDNNDIWTYIWGSQFYSSSRAYKVMKGTSQLHPAYNWLWKSSTRNILRRKNMFLPSYNCVLCHGNHEETVDHLFLHCPFVKQAWEILNLHYQPSEESLQIVANFKLLLGVPFFMEIIILWSWSIWTVRNGFIFNQDQPQLSAVKAIFKHEFALVIHRAKSNYFPLITQ